MRWIVAQKNRVRNGELYRFIADSKGAFVQVRGVLHCNSSVVLPVSWLLGWPGCIILHDLARLLFGAAHTKWCLSLHVSCALHNCSLHFMIHAAAVCADLCPPVLTCPPPSPPPPRSPPCTRHSA